MLRLVGFVVLVATAVALPGCGGGGKSESGCAAPVRERLDPNSAQHLVGDAEPPPYLSHPPTSGAHKVGRWPAGTLTKPIDEPVQVAMLEGGAVLLQYRDLSPADRKRLETLSGGHVSVAPNAHLPDRVVATAWTWKQTCGDVDVPALRTFIATHGGVGA